MPSLDCVAILALAEDQTSFLEAGANGILTKPIEKSLLRETLHKFIPVKLTSIPPLELTPSTHSITQTQTQTPTQTNTSQ